MPTAAELKEIGPFVALVFALIYGAYVLIPKALGVVDHLVVEFRAESKEARATFSSEMHETRTQFAEELEKRDKAIEKLADAVDRISTKISGQAEGR